MKNKYNGLNNNQVLKNQQLYGLNILNNNTSNKFIEIIKNPMTILLILIIIMYIILNQIINAIILSALTLLIIIIEIFQKRKIKRL